MRKKEKDVKNPPKHPVKKEILSFFHCQKCCDEFDKKNLIEKISRADYQQIEVGWTLKGVQIWCKRHDMNILHIDFLGQKITSF